MPLALRYVPKDFASDRIMRLTAHLVLLCAFPFLLTVVLAQDASTGAIRGTVHDPTQARVVGAGVVVTNLQTGLLYNLVTDDAGVFPRNCCLPETTNSSSTRLEWPLTGKQQFTWISER